MSDVREVEKIALIKNGKPDSVHFCCDCKCHKFDEISLKCKECSQVGCMDGRE